jgi:hypothetical protein
MADGEITWLPGTCSLCGGFAWRSLQVPTPPVCGICYGAGNRGDAAVLKAAAETKAESAAAVAQPPLF